MRRSRAAERAVRLRERLDDRSALGRALATLALQQWTNMRTDDAAASASRAVDLLRPAGDSAALKSALASTWAAAVNVTAMSRAWPRSTRPSRWGSGSALTRCGRRR